MSLQELRMRLGATQKEFAARYHIPLRTVQNWEAGARTPPAYVQELLEQRIRSDLLNRKTTILPLSSPRKSPLPRRRDYLATVSWLQAVRERMGEDVVFALDEALMCQEYFLGRHNEYLVWVYGPAHLARFNGVVVLGERISSFCVQKKHGLLCTDFNRTLTDALANEDILDMQGITEALSKYYYCNGESFSGLFVPPEYQERFELLAKDAVEYYDS